MIPQTHSPLRFVLEPGEIALHQGMLVVIEQRPKGDEVEVRDLATGQSHMVRVASLRGRDSQTHAPLVVSREEVRRNVEDGDWATARRREQILSELLTKSGTWQERVSLATRELMITPRTLYRWLRRYRATTVTSSLLHRPRGRHAGKTQLDAKREQLLSEVINAFFLKQPRLKPEDIYREANRQCKALGLPSISRGTVHARISALDAFSVNRARYGAKHARATLGPAPGSLVVERALDRMQIDHTQVDVQIVDEVFRLPIGRPWISVATDVATRMIVGFYLSLEAPSEISVALCVAHAVLPKDSWLAERQLQVEWPTWGIPHTIHVDNGKDFHGEALRRGCDEYGIQLEFRPPGQPHFGGHIERLIGTLMQRVHTLPGTTYSNLQGRGDYPSEEQAVLTLKELERWLTLEICSHYHGTVHRSLNTAPLVAWEQSIIHGVRRALPQDPKRFLIDFLPVETRVMQRDGLHLWGLRYWSDALPSLVSPHEPVLIRYDPRDISKVCVRTPRSTDYLEVRYSDLRWPAVSLSELEAIRAELRRQGATRIRADQMFVAIAAQRAIVDEARRKRKDARRAFAQRPAAGVLPPTNWPVPSASQPVSIDYNRDPEIYDVEVWEDKQ